MAKLYPQGQSHEECIRKLEEKLETLESQMLQFAQLDARLCVLEALVHSSPADTATLATPSDEDAAELGGPFTVQQIHCINEDEAAGEGDAKLEVLQSNMNATTTIDQMLSLSHMIHEGAVDDSTSLTAEQLVEIASLTGHHGEGGTELIYVMLGGDAPAILCDEADGSNSPVLASLPKSEPETVTMHSTAATTTTSDSFNGATQHQPSLNLIDEYPISSIISQMEQQGSCIPLNKRTGCSPGTGCVAASIEEKPKTEVEKADLSDDLSTSTNCGMQPSPRRSLRQKGKHKDISNMDIEITPKIEKGWDSRTSVEGPTYVPDGNMLEDEDSLKQYVVHQNKYYCTVCNKGYTRLQTLRYHVMSHTGKQRFTCDACGKKFPTKTQLRSHEHTHLGEKPFECRQCGKTYARQNTLQHHLRVHQGLKECRCKLCNKGFGRVSQLNVHLKTHVAPERRPHMCSDCGKTFAVEGYLKAHAKVHSSSRPLACAKCGKTFKHQQSLRLHEASHRGSQPYSCSQCERRFTQLGTMKAHMRIHTGETKFSCGICGKKFIHRSSYKTHLKAHAKGSIR